MRKTSIVLITLLIASITLSTPAIASEHGNMTDEEIVTEALTIVGEINQRIEDQNNRVRCVEPAEPITVNRSGWRSNPEEFAEQRKNRIDQGIEEAVNKTVTEINCQSQDEVGFRIIENPDEIETPQDLRDEATRLENEFGGLDRINEATTALRDTADLLEKLQRLRTLMDDMARVDWENLDEQGVMERLPNMNSSMTDNSSSTPVDNESNSNIAERNSSTQNEDTQNNQETDTGLPGFTAITGILAVISILALQSRYR